MGNHLSSFRNNNPTNENVVLTTKKTKAVVVASEEETATTTTILVEEDVSTTNDIYDDDSQIMISSCLNDDITTSITNQNNTNNNTNNNNGTTTGGVVRGFVRSFMSRFTIGQLPKYTPAVPVLQVPIPPPSMLLRQPLPINQIAKVSDRIITGYDFYTTYVETKSLTNTNTNTNTNIQLRTDLSTTTTIKPITFSVSTTPAVTATTTTTMIPTSIASPPPINSSIGSCSSNNTISSSNHHHHATTNTTTPSRFVSFMFQHNGPIVLQFVSSILKNTFLGITVFETYGYCIHQFAILSTPSVTTTIINPTATTLSVTSIPTTTTTTISPTVTTAEMNNNNKNLLQYDDHKNDDTNNSSSSSNSSSTSIYTSFLPPKNPLWFLNKMIFGNGGNLVNSEQEDRMIGNTNDPNNTFRMNENHNTNSIIPSTTLNTTMTTTISTIPPLPLPTLYHIDNDMNHNYMKDDPFDQALVKYHYVAGFVAGTTHGTLSRLLDVTFLLLQNIYQQQQQPSKPISKQLLLQQYFSTTTTTTIRSSISSTGTFFVPSIYSTVYTIHHGIAHSVLFGTYEYMKRNILQYLITTNNHNTELLLLQHQEEEQNKQQQHKSISSSIYHYITNTSTSSKKQMQQQYDHKDNVDRVSHHHSYSYLGGGYFLSFGLAGGIAGQIQHIVSHYTDQIVNQFPNLNHNNNNNTTITTKTNIHIPSLLRSTIRTFFQEVQHPTSFRPVLVAFLPSSIGFIAFEYGKNMTSSSLSSSSS